MTKAYDINDLIERFKGHGLDLLEDEVKLAVGDLFGWVEESAKLSATPYDDMALVILHKLKEYALTYADKIDGAVG